jgi:hypothetical protein
VRANWEVQVRRLPWHPWITFFAAILMVKILSSWKTSMPCEICMHHNRNGSINNINRLHYHHPPKRNPGEVARDLTITP